MNKYKLPSGVMDYTGSFAKRKLKIEQSLMTSFMSMGYDYIVPPIITGYNIYSGGLGAVEDKELFKISDRDGSLLVLRNDMTMPISRIISTKFANNLIKRVCYVGTSFCLSPVNTEFREFSQAGIELFNVSGSSGDAEVIILAIAALKACGLQDFQIDIGQVGILKGLLEETKLTDEDKLEVIASIDKKIILSKDMFPLLDVQTIDIINQIILLYGGKNVLDEARDILTNQASLIALDNLENVYNILEGNGLSSYISFDLGLVNSFSYYSGVVFKGITKHFGSPILGGGRYDQLTSNFNKEYKATGFAIGIYQLLSALERQDNDTTLTEDVNLILALDDSVATITAAYKLRTEISAAGIKPIIIYLEQLPEIELYKNHYNCSAVYQITNGVEVKI